MLIDPGAFSFIEERVKPEDLGPVDVVILTHKHPDHFYPEALKKIYAVKPFTLVASEEICELTKKEGLGGESIKAEETREIEGFTIKAFEAPHGPIPVEPPHNLAYLINNTLLHPGDSFEVKGIAAKVFALPVAGPWARLVDALEIAKELAPKKVVPIHDAIIKDFMLERIHAMSAESLGKNNISFHSLKIGEEFEA